MRHRTEAERHLIDAGERLGALCITTVGVGADGHQEQRRVGVDRGAGEPKEFFAFRTGVGREQLLALIQAQDRKRVGRLGYQRALRRSSAAARAAER